MRVLVFLFLFAAFDLNAQSGFEIIEKAERMIEKGRYEKATRLLDQADTMNYGFCGNAWMDANAEIMDKRIKIAKAKGDTMLVIDLLSDTTTYYSYDRELFAYALLFQDKESIRSQFKAALLSSENMHDLYISVLFSFREKPLYFKDRELLDFTFKSLFGVQLTEQMVDEFLNSGYEAFIANGL